MLGADNPQTLRAEHNLALCHYRSRATAARPRALFTRVLERCERVLGEDDPLTLMFAASQSCFAREHADIDQAREISETRRRAATPTCSARPTPTWRAARANHALILRNVGEREHAHVLIEEALADMTAGRGREPPLDPGLCDQRRRRCAISSATPSPPPRSTETPSRRATEALGRTHPLTLSARIAHAADLRGVRDRQRAEKIESEALGDLVATLGAQHVHTVSARSRNRPYWDFEPQII